MARLLLPFSLTAAACLWTLAIVAAPMALAHPGSHAIAAPVYAGASRICHQRPERSFRLAGMQMPVCARCAGLYVSGALGAVVGWLGAAGATGRRSRLWVALSAAPTAITWTLEAAGIAPFSNVARFVAALPLGAYAGWLFVRMLRYHD